MRISSLIRFVEDKAVAAAPRIGHAFKNSASAIAELSHKAKIEANARLIALRVEMVNQAIERNIQRAENKAVTRARQIVERAEIEDRALELLNAKRKEG